MHELEKIIGLCVDRSIIDIQVLPGKEYHQFDLEKSDTTEVCAYLKNLYPTLIIAQQTKLAEDFVAMLQQSSLPLVMVPDRPLQHFAEQTHFTLKTGTASSNFLAHFGLSILPEKDMHKAPENKAFNALLSRRLQLIEMLMAEKNRLMLSGYYAVSAYVRQNILVHIDWLEQQLEEVDLHLKPFWLSSKT
ncbi:hypothetical protein QUF61_09825 [Candidatus Venteria ishoeyi]|uniref:hypothetical protein n=1 Tax=Candidatus Venteria ishoeyi TaxID=1899563 RepID=UPI0025A4E580|nr:hypothetical protein [Candidatus Venteria ishoeyi]MDM8546778.1 hypothetical protein [Candidatus Venteria ishoeyi]